MARSTQVAKDVAPRAKAPAKKTAGKPAASKVVANAKPSVANGNGNGNGVKAEPIVNLANKPMPRTELTPQAFTGFTDTTTV